MRKSAMFAATLLLGAFAADVQPHTGIVYARMLSLQEIDGRWVLRLDIQDDRIAISRRATVQIRRVPECIVNKDLYLGTQEEFAEAIETLRAQIADGGAHRFGLNARPIDGGRSAFLAVNLQVTKRYSDSLLPVVLTVPPEIGLDLCPFKYDANR